MAINPVIMMNGTNKWIPTPFERETIILERKGIQITLNNIPSPNPIGNYGKWNTRGNLYLTDIRLVFIPNKFNNTDEIRGFDMPLCYIKNEKFNQPIFGCNHIAGKVWPAIINGGPGGQHPPIEFKLYFMEGGVGTLLPLLSVVLKRARAMFKKKDQNNNFNDSEDISPDNIIKKAFIDPNDPAVLFLTQPEMPENEAKPSAPKYAPYFDDDDKKYEPMYYV